MRLAARIDRNQHEIVQALRKAGATVQHLHTVGKGCPDLLVGCLGKNYLLEIKDQLGSLTPDEIEWHRHWNGRVHVVRSAEEAIRIIRNV